MSRKGGTIYFKIDGVQYDAIGNFSYGLGTEKRESLVGSDGYHGYKGMPQASFIEGEIRDRSDFDLKKFAELKDVTVTLELGNGKVIVQRLAAQVGEGAGNSEDGNIPFRFEGPPAEEVR